MTTVASVASGWMSGGDEVSAEAALSAPLRVAANDGVMKASDELPKIVEREGRWTDPSTMLEPSRMRG